MVYFAYGSNMSRARLEARVGGVAALGRARVSDYRHAFAKRGRDGTGKGTVIATHGASVYGVLFELSARQLLVLDRFEGGYRRIEIDAAIANGPVRAVTYEALAIVDELAPSPDYLAHYLAGMAEHALPADYVALIRRQARAM